MNGVEVMHWAEKYRGGGAGFGAELQARTFSAYQNESVLSAAVHPSSFKPQVVLLPAGCYWVDRTIHLPPGVSLMGVSCGTTLEFEDTRGNFKTKPSERWYQLPGLNAGCLVCWGATHAVRSYERTIQNLTIHARGQADAIVLVGREVNPRFKDLHLHLYGDEVARNGYGIRCTDIRANEPNLPWSYDPPVKSHSWLTSAFFRDVFVEGFDTGMEISGADLTFSHCQFWEGKLGFRFRACRKVQSDGHHFTRMKSGYHISNYTPNFFGEYPDPRDHKVNESDDFLFARKELDGRVLTNVG